jgi:hypothetical protein
MPGTTYRYGYPSILKSAATLLGTGNAATYALTPALIFVVNPNGIGNQTWTVAGTKATSVGASSPSTDQHVSSNVHFNISVDGSAATSATCNWTTPVSCTTGATIATQLQTAIQALGGVFAAVTVAYTTVYTFTSGTYGSGSHVTITPGTTLDCTAELKIGTHGASETAGTGDAVNLAVTTVAECLVKLNGLSGIAATAEPATTGKIRITSTTVGLGSSLVMSGTTTLTGIGITGSAYGCGT